MIFLKKKESFELDGIYYHTRHYVTDDPHYDTYIRIGDYDPDEPNSEEVLAYSLFGIKHDNEMYCQGYINGNDTDCTCAAYGNRTPLMAALYLKEWGLTEFDPNPGPSPG